MPRRAICYSWKATILLGLLFIILVGFLAKKYLYDTDEDEHFEETLLSQSLQKIIDYGTTLHLLEIRTRKLLNEDPYAELVEVKLMPTHERMQSIKKQTKIYEDMERIPGGPQNFMTTALSTVEEIRKKIVAFEEEYFKISAEISREITILDRDTQKSWNQAKNLLTENDLRVTLLKGIFLDNPSRISSDPDSDSEHDFPKDEKRPFEEIIESLAALADLASKFEKVKSEFDDLVLKNNITEPDDIYDTPAFPLAKELSKLDREIDVKIRDENYQAFIPYVRKYLKKLDVNLQAVQTHLAKKRLRYENLVEMLETDQSNLKDRIKNLKYSKPNEEF